MKITTIGTARSGGRSHGCGLPPGTSDRTRGAGGDAGDADVVLLAVPGSASTSEPTLSGLTPTPKPVGVACPIDELVLSARSSRPDRERAPRKGRTIACTLVDQLCGACYVRYQGRGAFTIRLATASSRL